MNLIPLSHLCKKALIHRLTVSNSLAPSPHPMLQNIVFLSSTVMLSSQHCRQDVSTGIGGFSATYRVPWLLAITKVNQGSQALPHKIK